MRATRVSPGSARAVFAFAATVAGLGACGGGGGDDDGMSGDGGGSGDGAPFDGTSGDGGGDGGGTGIDGGGGSGDGGGGSARILFQCDAFNGGLCTMNADGTDRQTVHATGFVPHGLSDGAILFHTPAYRVSRRSSSGNVADLGDGAMARPHPDGRILFQCAGLAGGICVMNSDGSNRQTIKATGRVPDIDAGGRILFHSDDYRVWRRDAGGGETDLGAGAFATWTTDGRIVFQCTGLNGGLCRMNADGSSRETLSATGRVPAAATDAASAVVFHTDAYQVTVRTSSGTTPLGAGANAVWR
jgi:hypothetical protein